MIGDAVSEHVRRYRAIASLCRQAAAFRPVQKFSLLRQAKDWEHLTLIELESLSDRNYVAVQDLNEPAGQQNRQALAVARA